MDPQTQCLIGKVAGLYDASMKEEDAVKAVRHLGLSLPQNTGASLVEGWFPQSAIGWHNYPLMFKTVL